MQTYEHGVTNAFGAKGTAKGCVEARLSECTCIYTCQMKLHQVVIFCLRHKQN